MSVEDAILLTLVTLLSFNIKNTYGECVSKTSCTCLMSNGEGYNLSKITGPNDDFVESTSISNRTFFFHPCHDKPLAAPGKNTKDCSSDAGVSLCLYNATNDQSINYGIVKWSQMTLKSNDKPQFLINSTLSNGTQVFVSISLVCNPFSNVPSLFTEYKSEAVAPNYDLVLVSPFACKKPMNTGGLSTGSILVILLFVFSGFYFLGGALALKLLRGATGWEMLPNQKFWFDLPALVRDGIAFTFNGCKVVSYDQI